jgi:GNAT superfamily N-acetyltransferase
MTTPDATHLTESQLDEAGAVLGRAFYDDPLSVYLLPNEEGRADKLEWFFGAGAKYGHMYGEVHTTPETFDGAACWLPPGEADMGIVRMARAGMLMAPFKLGFSAMGRFFKIMGKMEELHKRDMPMPHWYLMILGVDTVKQGKGIGGSLVAPMLARADAEKLPCYLETMKEINVAFYTKHGFEVIVEDDFDGLHYWTMKRPVQA